MRDGPPKPAIAWREWSAEAFEEARQSKRLVLLDLSAQWCHWCHVMDETTYSNAEIIRTVNQRFVPVRVDIDKRPDISERYNRGGFPTTAFLSDRGEPIWGSTYIPPEDMKNVLKAMLEAVDKGEVDQALAQERMQYLDLSKALERKETVDAEFVDAIFEDVFAAYDIQWGGFGIEPKFPHPDAVNLLLERYARTHDQEVAAAVTSTLDNMTRGLYDRVEGGVFRYSVKRDWTVPHYEKMLDTNAGFLSNLARASVMLGLDRYGKTAKGVAGYLLGTLRDPRTGAFYGSQDADEEYYKLDADMRKGRLAPRVIEETFSGLNCRASSSLIEAGVLLGEKGWVAAGKAACAATMSAHWDPDRRLVRHAASGQLYLFDDQVDFLEALIAVAETETGDAQAEILGFGKDLVGGVRAAFSHPDGGYGDIRKESAAIGKLSDPERSIVANSRWARLAAVYGAAAYRQDLIDEARTILDSFPPKRVQAHGIFAAEYVNAWDVLEMGPRVVEIHGMKGGPEEDRLWAAAKRALNPSVAVLAAPKPPLDLAGTGEFAVICRGTTCSKEIQEPDELARQLKAGPPGQY